MPLQVGGYGRIPVFTSETAPAAPVQGDLWTKISTNQLYQYSGAAWVAVTTTAGWEIIKTDIRATNGVLDTGAAGVPTGYKYLMLIINSKAVTTNNSWTAMRFNNDTGNEYNSIWYLNDGTSLEAGNGANQSYLSVGFAATSINSMHVLFIINVAANDKIIVSTSGNGTPNLQTLYGRYHGAAAEISRIQIYNNSDTDLATGSSYILLGVRGS